MSDTEIGLKMLLVTFIPVSVKCIGGGRKKDK